MENTEEKDIYVTFLEALHNEIKTKGKVELTDVIREVFDEETAEFIISEVQKTIDEHKRKKALKEISPNGANIKA